MSITPRLQAISLAVAVLAAPACRADSTYTSPANSGSSASAHLNFNVVVPAVLYLRVGTGSGIGATNNAAVDSLSFTVPGAQLGNGSAIAASPGSGDLGNGTVTVRVFSNVGTDVNLNSSVSGQLSNGNGGAIAWSRITVTAAALSSTTAGFTNSPITHPAFAATSGSGTATALTAAGGVVADECMWTFDYANQDMPPAGTYGSTAAANGIATYTVTQL